MKKRFSGIIVVFMGIYMFLSCLSFLINGYSDYDVVAGGGTGPVKNWMGKIGAYTGLMLTYHGAGIGSLLWAVAIIMAGARLTGVRMSLLSFKNFIMILLGSFIIPLILAIVARGTSMEGFLCGGLISDGYSWLKIHAGHVGAPLVVMVMGVLFSLAVMEHISNIRKKGVRRRKTEEGTEDVLPQEANKNDKKETGSPQTEKKKNEKSKKGSIFQLPPLDLLKDIPFETKVSKSELDSKKKMIRETLLQFKVELDRIDAVVGPTVTLFEVVPAPGIRVASVRNREDDIGLRLKALSVRIIAPMPGRGTIGIEVPNAEQSIVGLKYLLNTKKFREGGYHLPVAIGMSISCEPVYADLARMPHLLIAGATGQGKSVCINSLIASLLFSKYPEEIKFVMIDPKKVELSLYNDIARYYFVRFEDLDLPEPVVTDVRHAATVLKALCSEMDRRTSLLKEASVRDIMSYNAKVRASGEGNIMPFIVLVIDEFADLLMTAGKGVEMPLARLAQMGRAVGIHLIIATQRPSTDVITGLIKANFPTRIAFRVPSSHDSRTILDRHGAERLIGRGDMLFLINGDIVRLQAPFISTAEVERIVNFIASQEVDIPEYVISVSSGGMSSPIETSQGLSLSEDIDPLIMEAARLVVKHRMGSASLIQRHFNIGYPRAGRIIDQLEKLGVVGPPDGSGKPRKVLIPDEIALEAFLREKLPGV